MRSRRFKQVASSTAEYHIWSGMRQRCKNKKCWAYKWYGGRGIKVCERWKSFNNFIDDMGPRPSKKHQIDRIDNDGNYSPENCRWVTSKENCNNRNNAVRIDGLRIEDIAKALGLSYLAIYSRYANGWSIDRIKKKSEAGRRISNRFITVGNETRTLTEWANQSGLSVQVISDRLKRGLSPEEAIDGKRQRPRGEKNQQAKLTAEKVIYIRKSTKTGRELCRELGVSDGLIYAVRANRIWRHV